MNKRQQLAPGARPVGPIYGDTWEAIAREARRVTDLPFGKVELDQYYTGGMNRTFNSKEDRAPKPDFYAYVIVTPSPEKLKVVPEPVKGAEYYSTADILRALNDMNYYGADQIVAKIRQRLSVRDDGRYTVEELKRAAVEIDHVSGRYNAEKIDKAALQARKNRVFDAHGGR